jgi:hypothetical protein
MLKALRNKKTAKKIWIILCILVLPAFILWGSGSIMRSKQEPTYAGSIFGKKISFLEYKDAMGAVRNQAIIQFGEDFSEKQKNLNLESGAWYRLMLLAEAKKRKIKANDREVIGLIQSYPFFQRKGQFDSSAYSYYLTYVFNTAPRLFEEQTRQNLILSKLYNTVTSPVTLTDEEIKEGYQKENEQISIYYIASMPSEFAKDISATEQDLKDYFVQNSFEFKQPLSFNIEYISLESEDKLKSLTPRLNKKEDFIKVAKDFGLTVKETGWFNQTDPIPGIGWAPEILNLISRAKVSEFLPPIKMDKYYYILRLKERKEPYIPDFETIKDRVKERFIKDKSQKLAKEKIENCLKKLKEEYEINPKAIDFEKIAKVYGLKSDSTNPFKYGSYIENIGASDNFWINALELKGDEFSGVVDIPSGFYIIKLKSRIPIDQKKFETEKPEFAQKLLLQKRQEYFAKFVEELRKQTQAF